MTFEFVLLALIILLFIAIIIIISRKQRDSDFAELVNNARETNNKAHNLAVAVIEENKMMVEKNGDLSDKLRDANSDLKAAKNTIRDYSLEQSEIYQYLRSQGITSRHEPDDTHTYPYPRPLLECVKELGERGKEFQKKAQLYDSVKQASEFFDNSLFEKPTQTPKKKRVTK